MMKLSRNEYLAILRQDFYAFIERSFSELNPQAEFLPNWYLEVIASELEACRRGEITRLILNMPPRSLKSHCASVAFVAWLLGHRPSAQVICASYGQELANKLALDCRMLMLSDFYQRLFRTRVSPQRQALQEFATTENGFRMATSIGGVLTGRGADYIIIDDPLKPDEAVSDVRRKAVNEWFDQTLYSRLNDKRKGCIILIMQRLHEDDLVGHVQAQGGWKLVRFPAIAEEDEAYKIQTPYGTREFQRRSGGALQPAREPLEVLAQLRQTQGEYNFAAQYQQAPAPLGGGMVKAEWFKPYTEATQPETLELVFQSWDTANKPTELNDYSVCTSWAVKNKHLYLLHVFRKRLDYPSLKRAIQEQARDFQPRTILIEDHASGTQLIQDLLNEGVHSIKGCKSTVDKVMRMHSVTSTMENGFVHVPTAAPWLPEYLHELTIFPNGKYDDQADSTSQALDWYKNEGRVPRYGFIEYLKQETIRLGLPLPDGLEACRIEVCPHCGNSVDRYGHNLWHCRFCAKDGQD